MARIAHQNIPRKCVFYSKFHVRVKKIILDMKKHLVSMVNRFE